MPRNPITLVGRAYPHPPARLHPVAPLLQSCPREQATRTQVFGWIKTVGRRPQAPLRGSRRQPLLAGAQRIGLQPGPHRQARGRRSVGAVRPPARLQPLQTAGGQLRSNDRTAAGRLQRRPTPLAATATDFFTSLLDCQRVGLGVLLAGAWVLVRSVSLLAMAFGLSPVIVGATVVAFVTSAPEFVVSLAAGIEGSGDPARPWCTAAARASSAATDGSCRCPD